MVVCKDVESQYIYICNTHTCIRMSLFVNLPQTTNYCEFSLNIRIHLLKILTLLLRDALEDYSWQISTEALFRSDLNT